MHVHFVHGFDGYMIEDYLQWPQLVVSLMFEFLFLFGMFLREAEKRAVETQKHGGLTFTAFNPKYPGKEIAESPVLQKFNHQECRGVPTACHCNGGHHRGQKKAQLALWRLSCQSPMTKQPTDFGTVHSAGYLRLAGRPGSQG